MQFTQFRRAAQSSKRPVAVVDQYLVDKYFKGRSAIGQEIQRGGPDSPTIPSSASSTASTSRSR